MKKGLTYPEFEKLVYKGDFHYPINDLMCIMSIAEEEGDILMEKEILRAMFKYYIRVTKKVETEKNYRGMSSSSRMG